MRHFRKGVEEALRLAEEPDPDGKIPGHVDRTRMEGLRSIASHNSYHLGQVALIRRMPGSWPPPKGGDSW
ncbi:hypothetical protein C8P63_13131 [Melghirimyces profundicolus]|uniref:DinB family protein n=1 Tax=Melghirimyces profundicolus TaxID=1242148 RepID=A0A2T6B829_9BACL|nr:hypothetical protein [Melghirimyces profundicolus]PTX52215.1 hypothetical protein C8P63_13131 [Melghirimyces profundicolus]